MLTDAEVAEFKELGVPDPWPWGFDHPDTVEDAWLTKATAMLTATRFEEAAAAVILGCSSLHDAHKALPVARALVDRGGPGYAHALGDLAMAACEYGQAAVAWQQALDHQIDEGEPLTRRVFRTFVRTWWKLWRAQVAAERRCQSESKACR